MSPDLEQLLRRGADGLAGPSAGATRRARETALAAVARRQLRGRGALAVGGAVLVAAAAGLAAGLLALPDRGAASSPPGLGFLPAQGWSVLQAGAPTTQDRPGVAIAANVPLHPRDTSDGFPYSTLQALPEHGAVLVVSFFRLNDPRGASSRLPLSLRDAVPYIRYGGQVRPRLPLGQYELRAVVEGYAVDVQAYFGMREPSQALLAEAQRQLDRLVVSPEGEAPAVEAPRAPARGEAVTIAFQRYWFPSGNYYQMRFYGTISSGAAGEYVTVLKKECRASYSTGIAGTLTTAGGAWEATPDRPPGGGEFRARWKDEVSEPVTYRPPLVPWLEKARPGKFTATVSTYTPPGGTPQSMKGRRIDLQRLSAGRWVLMRSAELVRKKASTDSFFRTWVATFTVRTTGLRLRAFLPGQSALPCFGAGASKPLRS